MYNVKEVELEIWVKSVRIFEQLMRAEIAAKNYGDHKLARTIRQQRTLYRIYL